MDWLAILAGVFAWQRSDERCKNPHFNSDKGREYLKAAGFNPERQHELEEIWRSDRDEFNTIIGRESYPAGRKPKNEFWDCREDVKAALYKEGYKYYNFGAACQDPYYRKLTGLYHYNSTLPDTYLMPPEELAQFKSRQQIIDRKEYGGDLLVTTIVILEIIIIVLAIPVIASVQLEGWLLYLIVTVVVCLAVFAPVWALNKYNSVVNKKDD